MKTTEQRAKEAWEDYCYTSEGNLYSSVFQDAYKQGAEEAMRQPWIRWADRKPEEGTPIIAVTLNWNYGNPAYEHKYFGDMNKSVAEYVVGHNADNTYWLPLPQKGKEGSNG